LAPPERQSDKRKQFVRINREAKAAATGIRRVGASLTEFRPVPPPGLYRFMELGDLASRFDELAWVADRYAQGLRSDRGGPRGMIGFHALVERLVHAFEKATESEATVWWNESKNRFGGLFIKFARQVLHIVLRILLDIPHPNTKRRQALYIYKVVSELRHSRALAPNL